MLYKKSPILLVLLMLLFIAGCTHLADFQQSIPDHTILLGEWKSVDGSEYIKIEGDAEEIVAEAGPNAGKVVAYQYAATGKGRFMFGRDILVPDNQVVEKEAKGTLRLDSYKINQKNEHFRITWENPVGKSVTYGLFRPYRAKPTDDIAVYTFAGDPDDPKSWIALYKVPKAKEND